MLIFPKEVRVESLHKENRHPTGKRTKCNKRKEKKVREKSVHRSVLFLIPAKVAETIVPVAVRQLKGTIKPSSIRFLFFPQDRMSEGRMSEHSIADFVRRIRTGDEEAAAELVRQYEPLVRREIRLRLTDPGLCRVLDSLDICQSVMASFFVQAACGRYELDEPGQLIKLLVGMARNKLVSAARKQRAQRRDSRRVIPTAVNEMDPPDGTGTPSQIVAGKELLQEVQQRLSKEEHELAQRRAQGQAWEEIATALGGTANGRRVQLARALDRVARQLGLDT